MKATSLNGRIGLAVSEARFEHDLSLSELARRSGVHRATIRRLERGDTVRDDLATRVGLALLVVDAYREPEPPPFPEELHARLMPAPADVAEWEW
jgi:transcriptional regulator with XRE-family HTH domain